MKGANLARSAVALTILLHIPLRIGNLACLRLGQHLKFNGSRAGHINRLALEEHETKNKHKVEWSVSPDTAVFLERYLRRFHPLLAEPGSNYLFPGRGGRKAMSTDGLRYHIVRVIADELGAVVNPHLFRALTVRLILDDTSGAIEDARQMLGDKSMATVLAHYASLAPGLAAKRYDDVLRRARAPSVPQVLCKPRKSHQ